MTIPIMGKPDDESGTLRLFDSKGRHAATITLAAGVPTSITAQKLGAQTLLGVSGIMKLKAILGM